MIYHFIFPSLFLILGLTAFFLYWYAEVYIKRRDETLTVQQQNWIDSVKQAAAYLLVAMNITSNIDNVRNLFCEKDIPMHAFFFMLDILLLIALMKFILFPAIKKVKVNKENYGK